LTLLLVEFVGIAGHLMGSEDNSKKLQKFNLTSPKIILAVNKIEMQSPQF